MPAEQVTTERKRRPDMRGTFEKLYSAKLHGLPQALQEQFKSFYASWFENHSASVSGND